MINNITYTERTNKPAFAVPKKVQELQNTKLSNNHTSIPFNNSYAIAFLGKKDYTENELTFLDFRKQLARKQHKIERNYYESTWNFYINSSDQNNEAYNAEYAKLAEFASDKKVFAFLTGIKEKGVNDPRLKKSFNKLFDEYKEWVVSKEERESLTKKETQISQKFNTHHGEIDGKRYSDIELRDMWQTEKNVEMRKKIFDALKVQGGELIKSDLLELVKMRNEYAKKQGHSDYFSYALTKDYKTDEGKLFQLLDELDIKTDEVYKAISDKSDAKRAKAFGIEPKDIKPWHYGLRLEGNLAAEADKYVKNNEAVTQVASSMYKRMGWDLSKLPILMDLFPREGKNQHGFCFGIDKNKDVRILANLKNNVNSVETLLHESGHGVYSVGISDRIPLFDREFASMALTEAVAMLMESLPYREGTFVKDLDMPKELAEKLELQRQKDLVGFVRSYLCDINFEKQLYANPDQDIAKLWYDMQHKYLRMNIPEVLDNSWASVPHFLTHPAYLQNYLRAEIMAAQIYEAATQKLGPLTQNEKTAEFFRQKLFRFGSTLTDGEIIKHMTGKELGAEAFYRQIKDVAKLIK